jgi:hypothetical protein
LVAPEVTRTTKQTMFANPPKALCLHLSRSIYHNNYTMKNIGRVDFTEYIDLSPYSTNGYLNVTEPSVSLNSPSYTRKSKTSLVYLRNMAAGHKFNHGENNAGLAIALNNNKPDGDSLLHNVLPSMSTSTIQYKLSAVIVHLGGDHDSGHFVTYRRKKLPTGNQVRSPFQQQQHQIPSRFWRCDDESVEEVDIDTVLEQEAYMLFYERD